MANATGSSSGCRTHEAQSRSVEGRVPPAPAGSGADAGMSASMAKGLLGRGDAAHVELQPSHAAGRDLLQRCGVDPQLTGHGGVRERLLQPDGEADLVVQQAGRRIDLDRCPWDPECVEDRGTRTLRAARGTAPPGTSRRSAAASTSTRPPRSRSRSTVSVSEVRRHARPHTARAPRRTARRRRRGGGGGAARRARRPAGPAGCPESGAGA